MCAGFVVDEALAPAKVSPTTFGVRGSWDVDGSVYAQSHTDGNPAALNNELPHTPSDTIWKSRDSHPVCVQAPASACAVSWLLCAQCQSVFCGVCSPCAHPT